MEFAHRIDVEAKTFAYASELQPTLRAALIDKARATDQPIGLSLTITPRATPSRFQEVALTLAPPSSVHSTTMPWLLPEASKHSIRLAVTDLVSRSGPQCFQRYEEERTERSIERALIMWRDKLFRYPRCSPPRLLALNWRPPTEGPLAIGDILRMSRSCDTDTPDYTPGLSNVYLEDLERSERLQEVLRGSVDGLDETKPDAIEFEPLMLEDELR